MKIKVLATAVAFASLTLAGCGNSSDDSSAVQLKTNEQKVAYGMGLSMGKRLREEGVTEISPAVFAAGLADALAGKPQRVSDEELTAAFEFVQQRMDEKENALNDATAKAGKAFLEENAKRDGVKTTDSGLQYEVITAVEEGATPGPMDAVKVHYTGTLIDGSVFDSSVERGEPVEFPVMAVIPGWVEGLQLMKVGEKFKFAIPHELAYGAQSPTPAIPANSTLLFEVELLEIPGKLELPVPADAAADAAAEADVVEQIKAAIEAAAGQAETVVEDAVDEAAEVASDLVEKAAAAVEKAEALIDEAGDATAAPVEAAAEVASEAAAVSAEQVAEAVEKAEDMVDTARETAVETPVATDEVAAEGSKMVNAPVQTVAQKQAAEAAAGAEAAAEAVSQQVEKAEELIDQASDSVEISNDDVNDIKTTPAVSGDDN